MSPLANDTLLRALARQPTEYTPVWLMRQAGRYLPEYNAVRARAGSFTSLMRSPSLCVEVALQPLERYRLDAAIVFSDILTIPDAMGLGLSFAEGYETFSLAYCRKVFGALAREADGRRVPAILFTRGGGNWLEAMAESGCDAVSLDWTVDPRDARRRIGHRVALQGNLDPSVLLAPPENARAEARRILEAFGPAPGHVFNVGHGISPLADPDSVAAVVEEVRTHSREIRRQL